MRGLPACSLGGRAPCRASPAPTGGLLQPSRSLGCGARPGWAFTMKRGGHVAASFRFASVICPERAGLAGPAPCRASPAPTGGFQQPSRLRGCGARPAWTFTMKTGGQVAASFRFPSVICQGVQALPAERRAGQARHLRVGYCSLRVSVDAGLAPHGLSPWKEAARWPPLSAFRLSFARYVQVLSAERRAGQARHLRWVLAAFAFP